MDENYQKEKLIREINDLRDKILDLQKEDKSDSFIKIFFSALISAANLVLIMKILSFSDERIIGGFLIGFFVLMAIFSYNAKKSREKLEEQKKLEIIKLQAEIFSKSKELERIDVNNL